MTRGPASRRILRGLVATVIVVAVLAGWFAWDRLKPAEVQFADPSDAELVALGKAVYAVHCASCHGANLEGEPNWRVRRATGELPAPPHDASGHTWHHTDQQLFDITKHGIAPYAPPGYKSTMRGFGEVLSDREIWAVIAYIKSTWPEEIQDRQAAINARAEK